MYTDLMYAAVLYGPPASAHRIPLITGLLSLAGAVVPFALWREPEALLVGRWSWGSWPSPPPPPA
ncbi:hypothetical protein SVIOM74S_04055 [Streptomyces violarus]